MDTPLRRLVGGARYDLRQNGPGIVPPPLPPVGVWFRQGGQRVHQGTTCPKGEQDLLQRGL